MEKKNLYALVALLGLGALSYYLLSSPEKLDRVGERPRPLAEIKAGSIAQLEISQPGGTDKVALAKKGDKWQVTAPYDKPADQAAVKSVVESLEKMKWGDISTQQKERQAELEVSDDKGIHVVAKDAGGAQVADLVIGKVVGSSTMVRIGGKDDVWQATDLYASNFKKDGKSWREHIIFELKADEATKVSLKGGGLQAVLEKLPTPAGPDGKPAPANAMEAKWKLAEGDGQVLKPGMDVDSALVSRLVQSLSSLRAAEFMDAAKPEELGLAAGAAGQIEVLVTFKDNKTAGVRIGQLKGEDFFVQTLDAPQIFTVKKYGLDAVAHIPQDLRDKALVSFKADQLESVSIAEGKTPPLLLKKGDKGWLADKLPEADEAKIKSVVEGFDGLTGSGFVPPGAPELASLAVPKQTVTVKPKGTAAVVLKIGEARGEDVVVQKVGQDALWLKKYQVERFLKKASDLAKDKK